MMLKPPGNEVHLTTYPNGHDMSRDCWCEPVRIYWHTNQHGIRLLIVEHEDYTSQEHCEMLRLRNEIKDWISRALTPPWSPPLLPPNTEETP